MFSIDIFTIFPISESGRTLCVPTISRIIKQCKEYVTKQIGYSIWHTRFHDRIIRDEEEYQNKWRYIDENPARWAEDEFIVGEEKY